MKRMLADVRPELINEWSQRNLPLTPESVTHGSNKIVWWNGKCGHEWRAFLSYGIVEGTTLFVDLEIEYIQGELSCFVNKKKEFKLSETELDGYEYVGRIVAARNEFEV